MSAYHIPVLLEESIKGLSVKSEGTYVDVTFGGGGHSAEILKVLDKGKLYAFDQDRDTLANIPDDARLDFTQGNFRFLKNYMKYAGVEHIDGLIADLGVSSHHFNDQERGFTYRTDAALDMRMNRQSSLTAEKVINDYETNRLSGIFNVYGELREARKLAVTIDRERTSRRITSTGQLINCIESLAPRQAENQFFSKVFQAIRIEVNRELENLQDLLQGSLDLLKPGGRLVIISYHSLEDRMVKNFMRWGNTQEPPARDIFGKSPEAFTLITRKPITASDKEVQNNPRARSARLRIAEKN
jgi:16S rRNA (cytosine1402-N4)-methyltransferase